MVGTVTGGTGAGGCGAGAGAGVGAGAWAGGDVDTSSDWSYSVTTEEKRPYSFTLPQIVYNFRTKEDNIDMDLILIINEIEFKKKIFMIRLLLYITAIPIYSHFNED